MTQWLKLYFPLKGLQVLGLGAKIPHAAWPKKQNLKQKEYSNKFNKDFKNGLYLKILNLHYYIVCFKYP